MRGLLLSCLLAGCGLTLDLTPPVQDTGFTGRDAGVDAIPPDAPSCMNDSDCVGLPRAEPPTTCGDFRCQDNRCIANDQDGDGVGPGCEDERDCDDSNADIGVEGTILCPTAAPGICGESATLSCSDGIWEDACQGEQPAQVETCNGLDDDCDGMIDNGVPGRSEGTGACERRYVCSGGEWRTPDMGVGGPEVCGDDVDDDCDGTIDDPECIEDCTYVAIGAAGPVGSLGSLDVALSSGGDGQAICLVAQSDAGACNVTAFELNVDVPPSTTIIGGFSYRGGSLGRCSRDHMTRIVAGDGIGSRAVVQTTGNTQLIDLAVVHPPRTNDAVAIDANGGALVLSNVLVVAPEVPIAATPDESTGIRVNAGASLVAVSTDVHPFGYDSTGIDAEGPVRLLGGCASDPCQCESPAGGRGISGRGDAGRGVVVRGASLVAERYAVCGDGAVALELDGSNAFVADSALESFFVGTDAVSVHCPGTEGIWLHRNQVAVHSAEGGDSTGVSLIGRCSALLSSNTIYGIRNGAVNTSIGVYNDGAESALSRNMIVGADGSAVNDVFGLVCTSDAAAGSCRLVTENQIRGSLNGVPSTTTAVEVLDSSFSYLEGNQITGGCGNDVVLGLYAEDSELVGRANRVVGLECPFTAMGAHVAMDINDSGLTWTGNTVHGGSAASPAAGMDCETYGALINARAILRNNLFIGGQACVFNVAADVQGAPLMLYNGFTIADDLLYLDGSSYRDGSMLQADYPLFVGHVFDGSIGPGNFAGYPMDLRLTPGSPFVGAGSLPAGRTIDGTPHATPPSIGAYEL